MKFTKEELKHLCSRLYFPSINAIVIEEATNKLGDKFSEYFKNKERVNTITTGGKYRVIHSLFYINSTDTGINKALQIEWKIQNIYVKSIDKKYCKPLHEFIFKHCNPDGYWLLEKSVMESI